MTCLPKPSGSIKGGDVGELFYFLFVAALTSTFFLVYAIISTEVQSRRERQEWERLQAAQLEIKRIQVVEREPQPATGNPSARLRFNVKKGTLD
jgi:Flp pilus assembly protein TadB